MKQLTLGSIFDGSGGFPLGAVLHGITPVWASEIEPFPIRVTSMRFPQMKHYEDISQLSGGAIEPVDIITFGSPCTDMSVAGKRAGLNGKQSRLFYEAIRVIKEMREGTNGKYPRFVCFENVQGAFTSNHGADFNAILNEIVGIVEPGAEVPSVGKEGWPHADIIMGDGWSLAYRLVDAQFFAVPQRRKRIYLVADFGSKRAGEILFEREGVSRDFTPGFCEREANPRDFTVDVGTASGTEYLTGWDYQNHRIISAKGISPTLNGADRAGGRNPGGHVLAYAIQGSMIGRTDKNGPNGNGINEDISFTLNTIDRHAVAYDCRNHAAAQVSATLQAKSNGGQSLNYINPVLCDYIVRRMTPRECAMVQGFPRDWCVGLETPEPTEDDILYWTEVWESHRRILGKATKPKSRKQIVKWLRQPYSDSAEFKMWGNGVALPCVCFVMAGIREVAEKTSEVHT